MVTKETTATDVIKVFIADPLSEDGIYPIARRKRFELGNHH